MKKFISIEEVRKEVQELAPLLKNIPQEKKATLLDAVMIASIFLKNHEDFEDNEKAG